MSSHIAATFLSNYQLVEIEDSNSLNWRPEKVVLPIFKEVFTKQTQPKARKYFINF